MKRIALALAGALLIAGAGFAQSAPPPPAQAQAQTTKVTGTLELVQGVIGLKAGGKTYLVQKLQRVAGFIKGVQEGATVTVEGYARTLPYTTDVVFLNVTKLTVDGKDYDLSQEEGRGMARGERMGPNMQQNMMREGRW